MDKQTQEYFDSIVTKEPSALTSEEIGFLKARRSYLDPVQKEILGSVLDLTKAEKPLSNLKVEEIEPGTIVEVDSVRIVETTEPKAKKVTKKKK